MNDKSRHDDTPEHLKGKNVDERGLPLRMKFDQRRLDQPFKGRGFKFAWDHGVHIIPNDEE